MDMIAWVGIFAIIVGGFFLGRAKERQRFDTARRDRIADTKAKHKMLRSQKQ